MSTNENQKSTEHTMETIRITFDNSMNSLPKGISDSIIAVALGIDFLIKYDVDIEGYNKMILLINDGMDKLNKCVNDIKNIYETYEEVIEELKES